MGGIVKSRQRRKWLGLSTFLDDATHKGYPCWFCTVRCEVTPNREVVSYLGDCKHFDPQQGWKEAAATFEVTEAQAEAALHQAQVAERIENARRIAEAQADWEKQCAKLQAVGWVPL